MKKSVINVCIIIMVSILLPFSACNKIAEEKPKETTNVTIQVKSSEPKPIPTEEVHFETAADTIEETPETEEIPEEEINLEEQVFSEIEGKYMFGSGVGFWGHTLNVYSDGSFEGEFSDFNAGMGGTYYSKYSGYFCNVEAVDEYTYKMKSSDLIYEKPLGTEWDEDTCHYVFTEAMGMESETEFYVFKPGRSMADQYDTYRHYFENIIDPGKKLNYYVIFNNESLGIFVGEKTHSVETISDSTETVNTPAVTPVSTEKTTEISEFFTGYKILVSLLDMEGTETWQMSADSYVKNGFYLEYNTEYGLCSMKNEGNLSVLLYGCIPGNDVDTFENALLANGWKKYGNINFGTMYAKRNADGQVCIIDLYFGEDRIVTSWYWNNWPEGDYDFSYL